MPCCDAPNFSVLHFLLSLLLILNLPVNSDYQSKYQWNYCPTDANYTTNSTFQANLILLLSSLYSNVVFTGYANDSKGEPPYQAYGLAQCRADMPPDKCQSCLNTSTQEIIKRCPNGMSSAIWYEECLLRYSDQSFFSTADTSFNYELVGGLASDPEQFKQLLGQMMDNLTTTAANASPTLFATGVASLTNSSKIYALVQCTEDLPQEECYRCLENFVGIIPVCCDGRSGARVYGFSCYLRYETFPFFNPSKAISIPWQPPTDAPLSPSPFPNATTSPPSTNAASGVIVEEGKSGNTIKILVAVTVIAIAVVVLLLFAICIYLRRKKLARKPIDEGAGKEIRSAESLVFDLETLRTATDNFSDANKLGHGGFGSVYKGIISDVHVIAVKRLSISSIHGAEQLRNEVDLLVKLQHANLVKLLGYCFEEQEKLLVYEYLPNGSLDKFLFDPIRREQLEWGVRCRIIKRIGRGLLYIHEDSRPRIIHRDLKASNILLDGDMNPRISDFGLAKLFGMDETHESTRQIAGTYGYMAPEYVKYGHFSTKSDVFSYGVLVLEIVTGQRNNGFEGSGSAIDLPSYVWKQWNEGTASKVIDQSLQDRCELQEVLRHIHIGLLCVQADPAKRPSMASVFLMLDVNAVPLPRPSVPAFYVQGGTVSKSDALQGVSSEYSLHGGEW